MRKFDTGATRDDDADKLDYEGFLSPEVLRCFAEYMHMNRRLADGTMRASDNWQKGIPREAYMKSAWRHFWEWWASHRYGDRVARQRAVCALLFNVMGYLHEDLREEAINETAGAEPLFRAGSDIMRGETVSLSADGETVYRTGVADDSAE